MASPAEDSLATDDDEDWLEPEDADPDTEELAIEEYDLTSSPNDFNVKTIVDFLSSGVFEIPAFQRNYVWDLRRASKLIESLILGLPVPQVFLYERGRNKFLVIDGQQRLMSIHYFVVRRFPKLEKRGVLRKVFDEKGLIPSAVLADDTYFGNFNLKLPSRLPTRDNPLDGLNYETLGEEKTTFDLRTIRCVVIKQNRPQDDDSSVYEIFNRLNTGGVNLTPQEIRTSLYHSEFYRLLYRLNTDERWRSVLGSPEPDLRMRDVETLLRGFAMLLEGEQYRPSMTRFLNLFSKKLMNAELPALANLEKTFNAFLEAAALLPVGVFGTRAKRLNVSIFESVFAAACGPMYRDGTTTVPALDPAKIQKLKTDKEFIDAASTRSTDRGNVTTRLTKAREIFHGGASHRH